jgi:hypothetical protein
MPFWITIGRIMHAMNRHTEEVEAFFVAYSMDHRSPAAALLAEALLECREEEKAQRILEKAVDEGTEVGKVYMCLGRRYWDIDRKRDAARMYCRGTELEPNNLEWSLGYISLLVELGELDEAQKQTERIGRGLSGKRWAQHYSEVIRNRREELSEDLIIVSNSNSQLPRLVRDAGSIADWIHREVNGVNTITTNLSTAARTGLIGHFCVTGAEIRVDGEEHRQICSEMEERLKNRLFMCSDYEVQVNNGDRSGLHTVVLSLRLRPRRYLTKDELEHKGKATPELKERVLSILNRAANKELMESAIDCFLNAHCKCEQLHIGINLVESALAWDDCDPAEIAAAEECLKSLSDLRAGPGLLWMLQNKDALRPIWRQRTVDNTAFVSEVYRWFSDIRSSTCHTLCVADGILGGASTKHVPTKGESQDWRTKAAGVPETDEVPSG